MPFQIIRNDITKVEADAIVNAANPQLQMGGGVCGAIFAAAGSKNLQAECNEIGSCKTGEAVITKGYNLKAKNIIHTVGTVWHVGNYEESELLYNCYKNSLKLAQENNLESVAFPLISSGIFGYPKEEALNTAISAIGDFLSENEMMVYLVVYDKKAFEISKKRLYDVQKYIDDNYVDEHIAPYRKKHGRLNESDDLILKEYSKSEMSAAPLYSSKTDKARMEDFIGQLDESFSERLLRLIDEKELTDSQAYTKANITRQHFSKIRTKKDYRPSKETALAFAIALELDLAEALNLLETASFTLSQSTLFDVIIKYHIVNKIYDIYKINLLLFAYDQTLLGSKNVA